MGSCTSVDANNDWESTGQITLSTNGSGNLGDDDMEGRVTLIASHSPKVPTMKHGWAKKRGHNVPTWKKRFITLYEGTLKYYDKYDEVMGTVKGLKGELKLAGYTIHTDTIPSSHESLSPCMLYLEPTVGEKTSLANPGDEKDLLIDFSDGTIVEVSEWKNSLQLHIEYATAMKATAMKQIASNI